MAKDEVSRDTHLQRFIRDVKIFSNVLCRRNISIDAPLDLSTAVERGHEVYRSAG